MTHAGRGLAFDPRNAATACVFAVLVWACNARSPCDGVACAPACPRDSTPDARGRCVCVPGDLPVLGACVPPAVADSYCGPAARGGPDGCAFRACAEGELLDAVTGTCVAEATLPGSGTIACADGGASVVAQGRMTCVATDVACPRGTRRAGATCPRPTVCPPGTLASRDACRTVVTVGKHADRPRVDLGAWSALVFGVDGGEGSQELCRPLALRPDAFGINQGQQGRVSIQLSVVTPDQDLTRVHARAQGELTVASVRRPLAGEAAGLIASSLATLVEPLRSLGGEASAGVVELKVSCAVGSL